MRAAREHEQEDRQTGGAHTGPVMKRAATPWEPPPCILLTDRGGKAAALNPSVLDVDALGLAALLTLDHAECDLLALSEGVEAGARQGGAMDEHVLAAIVDRHEAE